MIENAEILYGQIQTARIARLRQILRVLHLTFIIMILINIPQADIPMLTTLALTAAALSFAYIPLNRGNVDKTAGIIILVIGICLSLVMWQGSGLRSSAMLAYPGLLMFTVIIGNRRLFMITYLTMVLVMVSVVAATLLGWRTGLEVPTTVFGLIEFLLVVSSITYAVNLLATDLFKILRNMASEVQQVKKSHTHIQHMADHDNLTGLPNRRLADRRFELALESSMQMNRMVALTYIDLDNFKTINDTYGHQAGDDVLQVLSQSISKSLRKTDTLIRQGGDEFLLILADIDNRDEVLQVLEKLSLVIKQVITLNDDISYQPGCSMGVTVAPDDGIVFSELLRKADTAMYQAKATGRNQIKFYDTSLAIPEPRAEASTPLNQQARAYSVE